jgi:hypothetical protein
MPARSALVYGDVNLNLIDGSAIWVQSMVLALSRAGCEVTLVVKAPVQTDRLLTPLDGLAGVTIRRPAEEELLAGIGPNGMTPEQASQALSAVDAERASAHGAKHDIVVLRGRRLVDQVVTDDDFRGRLWTYLTDIPQSIPEMTPEAVSWLAGVAGASAYVLCQTEELRCFLEGSVPEACGKCVLFPPVVPPLTDVTGEPAETTGVLRLVYTGKFAPRWNTYEMTELPGSRPSCTWSATRSTTTRTTRATTIGCGRRWATRPPRGPVPVPRARRSPCRPTGWCGTAATPARGRCGSPPPPTSGWAGGTRRWTPAWSCRPRCWSSACSGCRSS